MAQDLPYGISAFEATSLTNKFKRLGLADVQAKLVFESRAGQAWGTLEVHLGEHPGQHHQQPSTKQEHSRKHESPSQKGRRERREAARMKAAVDSLEVIAEKAGTGTVEDSDNIAASDEELVALTVSVAEEASDEANESVSKLKAMNEKIMGELKLRDEAIVELNEKVKILVGEK